MGYSNKDFEEIHITSADLVPPETIRTLHDLTESGHAGLSRRLFITTSFQCKPTGYYEPDFSVGSEEYISQRVRDITESDTISNIRVIQHDTRQSGILLILPFPVTGTPLPSNKQFMESAGIPNRCDFPKYTITMPSCAHTRFMEMKLKICVIMAAFHFVH